MEIIYELGDIGKSAQKFLEYCRGYRVFAFSGELGAGKTTFINAVCRQLGITENVTSPTYAIIQEYSLGAQGALCHIDMYRLKSVDEAIEAGVEDCLLSDKLCMVEWPEKATSIFPAGTVYSELQALSPNTRKMIVQLPQ